MAICSILQMCLLSVLDSLLMQAVIMCHVVYFVFGTKRSLQCI